MAQIASASYNRMMQPNYEQQLYDWLWEVMLVLRLHAADLPTPVMQFTQRQLPLQDELQGIKVPSLAILEGSDFQQN